MDQTHAGFKQYYKTGKYKGFYKIREQVYKLSGQTHVTFSNGEKEIFATGIFKEAAIKKIFDQIDELTKENSRNSCSTPSTESLI